MCTLTNLSKKEKAIGWKIVCVNEKNGRYYAPAMGILYPKKGGKIKACTKQKKIAYWFSQTLLYKTGYFYEPLMKGRTSIFVKKMDAIEMINNLYIDGIKPGFSIKIVKCEISKDLMRGHYNINTPIMAGRYIKWLK